MVRHKKAEATADTMEPGITDDQAEANRSAAASIVEQTAEAMKMPPADAPPTTPGPQPSANGHGDPQPTTNGNTEPANGHVEENGHAEAIGQRKPLPSKTGYWRDNEAGVRLVEDYKNKLTTMIFRDKAPAKAQELLQKCGYVKEDEDLFSKPIDHLRRREHREDAENLAVAVDNIIREEKGMPPKKAFHISRS